MNGASSATGVGAKIQGICPAGWHIPSDYNADANDDFQKLSNYLGGNSVAGSHLREAGTSHWLPPNTGADNSSNFTAVGAGIWSTTFQYQYRGYYAQFWSSFQYDATIAWLRYLFIDGAQFDPSTNSRTTAVSVRCVKN